MAALFLVFKVVLIYICTLLNDLKKSVRDPYKDIHVIGKYLFKDEEGKICIPVTIHRAPRAKKSVKGKKENRSTLGFSSPLLNNGLLVSASVKYVCMIEMITYLS